MKLRSLWRKRKDVMKLNDKEAESKARREAALQALHDENNRLGLYDYEIGFIDGKASVKRTWVGLTDDEIDQGLLRSNHALQTADAWRDGVEWAQSQLKERNT